MLDEKIIKFLNGHSGSEIMLMESDKLFVRKIGNTTRNYKKLIELKEEGYSVPDIYSFSDDVLDMEYINGLDISNYLLYNNASKLYSFICSTIDNFRHTSKIKDYTEVYHIKLKYVDEENVFPFTKNELIECLPKYLPSTQYHGDMTLENIIWSDSGEFYMIDPLESEYDSYIFDIAKMRQDLECQWFFRNSTSKIETKVHSLQEKILEKYPEASNDNLLILMLLRVYPNTKSGDGDREFLLKEIKRLWK
jgi:RIO-like serine/threonine protein kinase